MTTFTIQESNKITARNILVEGNVHITGDLIIPNVDNSIRELPEEYEHLAETITVTGDLYIRSDLVKCNDAIVYADLKTFEVDDNESVDFFNINIQKPETFQQNMNTSIKNVFFDAGEVDLYGKLVCEGNITAYSDEVFKRMRGAKISKIKSNIKK